MSLDNERKNWDDLKIIDSSRDDQRLLIKEMLPINNLELELNIQNDS
jgi:hypothetical protein